jgi:hypothetical protein
VSWPPFAIARHYWDARGDRYPACQTLYWQNRRMDRGLDAYARRSSCTVSFNVYEDFRRVRWPDGSYSREDPWWRYCATMVHEVGHLYGREHNRNPNSIMAETEHMNMRAWWWPMFPACKK